MVGVGNGGGWNGSTVCLLTTTNPASGFADVRLRVADE